MPAAWAGVAASVAGTIGSLANSGGAASGATGVSQQAINEAKGLASTNSATYQPFVDQGTASVAQQGNLLGLNGPDAASSAMASFTASPGYQYQLDQGLRAVDAGAAARGMGRSGATLKAEQTLGNNLANQDFGNYFTRLNQLSSFGLQGAQGQANTTAAYDNVLSGQATNQAQILGQSATQQNSLLQNGLSGVASGIKSIYGTGGTIGGGSGLATSPNSTFSGAGYVPTGPIGF